MKITWQLIYCMTGIVGLWIMPGMAQQSSPQNSTQRDALIKKYDRDGNGRLSQPEIDTAYRPLKQTGSAASTPSRTSRRTKEERRGATIKNDRQIQKTLEQFDQNHNGMLDYAEMDALRAALKTVPPPAPTPP